MKLEYATLAAVVLGMVLIGASFVWRYATTQGPGGWTEEQAQQHAQTRAELHAASHGHAHGPASKQDVEKAARARALQARFEAELAELESVRNRGETGALVLWWAGAALAAGGAAFYYLARAA